LQQTREFLTAGAFLPVATTVRGINANALVIQVALEIVVASVVVLTQGPARLSRTEQKQLQV
jgi:hypothetical protein